MAWNDKANWAEFLNVNVKNKNNRLFGVIEYVGLNLKSIEATWRSLGLVKCIRWDRWGVF